jgi:transcriptional regulator with XRE-family HTH domain
MKAIEIHGYVMPRGVKKQPEVEIIGKLGKREENPSRLRDQERRQRSIELVETVLSKLGGNASELARLAGVAPNTASQWRRGAIPDPKYLSQFCHLAGYTLQEALDFIEGRVVEPPDVERLLKEVKALSREDFARFHAEVCKYSMELLLACK